MNKKYQVFVSSTFADLKEERSKVIQTLMELDCIPAGMELFPAIDEEQFNFIKKVIDDCDYYVLIIGGRYGSVASDGLSYTEKEYRYAKGKNIKVIAFLHLNPDSIPIGKSEKETELRKKLEAFRNEIESDRLVQYWTMAEELPGKVALSLPKTIRTYPAEGWIRGNSVTNPEILQELNELRKENQELKSKLKAIAEEPPELIDLEELAGLDDEFILSGNYNPIMNLMESHSWENAFFWKEIFSLIGPSLLIPRTDESVRRDFSKKIFNKTGIDEFEFDFGIDDETYETIRTHLRTLGLVNIDVSTSNDDLTLVWSLTKKGDEQLMKIKGAKIKEVKRPKI